MIGAVVMIAAFAVLVLAVVKERRAIRYVKFWDGLNMVRYVEARKNKFLWTWIGAIALAIYFLAWLFL